MAGEQAGLDPPVGCNLCLFGSEASACEWQQFTSDPAYRSIWLERDGLPSQDLRSALHALAQRPLTHAALLGVGAGHVEEAVVHELERTGRARAALHCLLVDQNPWLLEQATARFRGRAARPCPADFEQGLGAVLDQARDGGRGEGSLLVTLLGVTFANLDGGDGPFVASLARCLRPGEAILLDVPVKRSGWSFAADSRSHVAAFPLIQKRFFATPLAERLAIPVEELLARFDERVVAIHCRDSSVPGTDTIRILDHETGIVIENFRRYDFPQLMAWMRRQLPLRVVHARDPTRAAGGPVGVSFLVLAAE